MSIIIGIDHGYYAIKTAHCSFPAGLTSYGEHEPYTRQGLLEFGGCFFVCGSGRQPIQRDKTVNDNYYLLTLAAIAKEILLLWDFFHQIIYTAMQDTCQAQQGFPLRLVNVFLALLILLDGAHGDFCLSCQFRLAHFGQCAQAL